jgi:hypothetical protein
MNWSSTMINQEQISKLLGRKVELFHSLEEPQLRQVSALLRERRFRKGEVIFHQHDPGGCMYFILSGEFAKPYMICSPRNLFAQAVEPEQTTTLVSEPLSAMRPCFSTIMRHLPACETSQCNRVYCGDML